MAIYSLEGVAPELPEPGSYWVAEQAVVLGRVVLARDVNVWFGAVLRGDNDIIRVGARSNIQDGAVLHTDLGSPLTIGEGCTIGHQAMLHGCTVGDNSLIGIGARVLNGAVIGRNCIIGAHALVAEGKEIPDNSLVVGVPGRVQRTLGQDEIAQLGEMAEVYVRNYKRYLARFEAIG